jgi:hypothetical protein
MAAGTVRITQHQDGRISYVSGELSQPEKGKFFFLRPPEGGKAGKAVGVIEFPDSQTAYRVEPTGANGEPELWQRRMDEVVCMNMPRAEEESVVQEMPPLRPDVEAMYNVPDYNSNIVSLQSYPGSKAVLLLDFFGGYTSTWGGIAYSRPANINNSTIKDLWKRVAEDYQPFNINVTTDIRVYQAAPAASRQRCCFTDTPVTAAGVAYIGSWNWGSDTPCWSVYNSGKNGAEVGAHEPGHTLGLGHQGSVSPTATNEYYAGQGSGVTGWAPIMGVGYYQNIATWAKGEYQYANNTQDELAVITSNNNNVTYRADDTGATLATSRYLEIYDDSSAFAEGVIERGGDTDAFQFSTTGGLVSLTANPVNDWANLAVMVTLADSSDNIIASNNPQSVISATITNVLAAGTYTFRVTGAGRNDPYTNGFTTYGSLGYYSVSGWIVGAVQPTRLTVMEHSAVGTAVGTVVSTNAGAQLAYAIVAGNSNSAFSIDGAGLLTVANSAALDYATLGSNSMLRVGFELFVNITNLDNGALTELSRRVVVDVRSATGSYPLAVSGFNAGVIVPNSATVSVPRAVAFDAGNSWCFYQAGLSGNAQAASGSGYQGFPCSRTLVSQVDGAVFKLAPYSGQNALLMGNTYAKYGTLTLSNPAAFNSISILASSANGGGNGTLVLTFTNGTRSQVFSLNAQDWYNTTTNVAFQGFGRVKLGQSTFSTENPGWNNPNIYQTTINLASLGINQTVKSITFTNPASANTTVVLGLSAAPMPAAPAIVQQPVSVTNSVPASGAGFSVVAMGTPPLAYQWYFSSNGAAGADSPLAGKTNATVSLSAVLQATNAGSYFVIVTNASGSVTSSVATLTVFRAPVITADLSPTNSSRLVGGTNRWALSVNAATPVYYFWNTNGSLFRTTTTNGLALGPLQLANAATYTVVVSNAYGMVTSLSSTLAVYSAPTSPYQQLTVAAGPIGYWRLDETSGRVAHDYIGTNNGFYTNVAFNQAGNKLIDTHTAVRVGSLAANNSYIGGIGIDFGASFGSAAFTVEAWVNGSTPSTDAGVITKGAGGGGEQFNLDCGGTSHGFRFFVRDSTGSAHLASSSVPPAAAWHHVVGVCDQSHSNLVLYVDGTNVATGTIVPGSGIMASSSPVTFGSRQSGSGTAFNNQMTATLEEFAIYGYAMTSNQVQARYLAVTNRPPAFVANPLLLPAGRAGVYYAANLTTNASDPNGDAQTFAKISGPAWLNVASGGLLTGTPYSANAGANSFVVSVKDPGGLSNTATMLLSVAAAPSINASLTNQNGSLALSWTGGVSPYSVQMSTNLGDTNWQTVATGVVTSNYLVAPTNGAAFFRIKGL